MVRLRAIIPAGLLLILAAPPLAEWWKAALFQHLLMQVPLLVLTGALVGSLVATRSSSHSRSDEPGGVAAVLLAAFCLAFWMLPRWLDAAVSDTGVDAVKIVSLVVLAGVPLAWGWPRLGSVARAFVWANAISMLAALGLLYLTFPDRLCNNYLVSEQSSVGQVMLGLAGILGLAGAARALFGVRPARATEDARQAVSA